MKELIAPPLIVNILMFIVGIVMGINPASVSVNAPGGLVYSLQVSSLVFGVIAISIAVSFSGFRLLGSGLSDSSVSIINKCVVYFVIWTVLSTITFGFLSLIPAPFGAIIYGTLTLLYSFGVFLEIASVGGGTGGGSGSTGGDDE